MNHSNKTTMLANTGFTISVISMFFSFFGLLGIFSLILGFTALIRAETKNCSYYTHIKFHQHNICLLRNECTIIK